MGMVSRLDDRFMRLAIDVAKKGIDAGQTPFGSVIVRNGRVIARGHNEVWKRLDSTAHAEIVAIQKACSKRRSIDLSDCTLYSTTEPCPMCFSAAHWAGIRRIVFGASIADAAKAGFNELAVSNAQLKKWGRSPVELVLHVRARSCRDLFDDWRRKQKSAPY